MTAYLSREEQLRLAEKVEAGHGEAFEKLKLAFFAAILGYIRGRVVDQKLAVELCEETFGNAYELLRKGGYKKEFSFYTFLHAQANYVILDYFKKYYKEHSLRVTGHPDDETSLIEAIPDSGPTSVDIVTFLELITLVCRCCAKPHMIVAFGLNKLLDYGPQGTINAVCEKKLGYVVHRLIEEYYCNSHMDYASLFSKAAFHAYFAKLHEKCDSVVEDVYTEQEYAARREEFRLSPVKDLPFELFFLSDNYAAPAGSRESASSPEDAVARWSHRVQERVKTAIEQREFCR